MKILNNWKKWMILFAAFLLLAFAPEQAEAAENHLLRYFGHPQGSGGSWRRVEGKTFYYTENGDKVTGWFRKEGRKYYCDPERGKLQGWNEIGGVWHYFQSSGCVAVNRWIPYKNLLWYVNGGGKVKKEVLRGGADTGYDAVLIVGGSRIFHTSSKYRITAKNVRFLAQGGAKFSWLKNEAYPRIQRAVVKGKKTAIVFNMGLNDLRHVDRYLEFYNRDLSYLLDDPDCDLYMMSVNPIDEKKYALRKKTRWTKHNWQVQEFNQKMRSQLDSRYRYVDTYQYLSDHYDTGEITVRDGIHYTRFCSRLIFQLCMLSLKKQ